MRVISKILRHAWVRLSDYQGQWHSPAQWPWHTALVMQRVRSNGTWEYRHMTAAEFKEWGAW